jgi:signal peptidase I
VKKNLIYRILNVLISSFLILFGVVVLYFLVRIFAFDSFPVNTTSMTPAIQPGDRILVNKLIFGARIYKSFDFSDGAPLESWRMPGWREIRHNDIVVFNYPRASSKHGHRINFNFSKIYVKRCVGLPGDTLSIQGGFFHNSNTGGPVGSIAAQQDLSRVEDIARLQLPVRFAGQTSWTARDMGPLYIPRKGDTILLDPSNTWIYQLVIEFETQGKITNDGERILLNEVPIEQYIFQRNYYFMCGDYLVNSVDSRSWGFVPEEYIIGVTRRVLVAHTESGKMNWRRFLKRFDK